MARLARGLGVWGGLRAVSFVIFTNAALMIAMGGLMGIVGLLFPDTRWVFLSSGLVVALTGGFVVLSVANRLRDFRTLHAFVLTGTIWITGAAAGAVPLWVWQLSPVDAFFESMSGITTTGSTVMTGLDGTAKGILLWRAILHGIGGIGFVVAGIAFLPILRVGGMQLFRTESSDRGDKEMASAAKLASATVWIYLGLIALCTAVYFGGGMTFFEAVCHALATLSTGGYTTSDSSFGYFQSPFLEWSATVFMLAGALPFAWYIRALNKGVFTSEQVRAFLIFLTVTISVMTVWRVATSDSGVHDALRQSAFNIVSVVTTTGFMSTDYLTWGPFAVVVFFFLTAVGGCTGSTAGGAKMMRWIIFGRFLRTSVRSIHSPNSVSVPQYEGKPVTPDVLSGVMMFFTFYVLTVGVLGVLLGLLGLDPVTAISGALTAVANVGPGVGPIIGPAGNFSTLPDSAKVVLSFGMYVGRLEIVTVYVLMTRRFWQAVS
jgi:trk system potassium uptake protein TrkH